MANKPKKKLDMGMPYPSPSKSKWKETGGIHTQSKIPSVKKTTKTSKKIRKSIASGTKTKITGTSEGVRMTSRKADGSRAGEATIFTPSSNTVPGGKELKNAMKKNPASDNYKAPKKPKAPKKKKRPSDTTGFGHRSTYAK